MTILYDILVNRVLRALNEVPITDSTTFASATGFHADVKDAVNMAIFDIYTEQEIKWPFARDKFYLVTEVGTREYTPYARATNIDWNSFYIDAAWQYADIITRTGTVAEVETGPEHTLMVGDTVIIFDAADVEYNGSWVVTSVPDIYTFTFTVPNTFPTSSDGKYRVPYSAKKLLQIEYEGYLDNYLVNDINRTSNNYGVPEMVVRDPSNNIIISPTPNRPYRVSYDYYTIPNKLYNWNEVVELPDTFEQIAVDKALHYAYMFRDNLEQAQLAEQRYQAGIFRMRKNLIPQPEYLRYT